MSIRDLIRQWNVDSTAILTEVESKQLLKEAGIPVAEAILVHSAEEVAAASAAVGFPLVMKVVSRQRLQNLPLATTFPAVTSEAQARRAYKELLSSAPGWQLDAPAEGVSLQRAMRQGVELRMAVEQDPLFGPVVSFGFGRMGVEIWGDVSYRVVPLSEKDARFMVGELKGQRLLEGYGGLEPPDVSRIVETLLRLSDLVEHTPEVWEVELDPVYAYADGLVVLDARAELRAQQLS